MNDSVDLSVALDMLNRRITELNIKIVNGDTSEETKKKLNQILKLKQEIFGGNVLLIKEIINGKLDV